MTTESLQYQYDKFLVLNGRDANAVLCTPDEARDLETIKFAWDHNLAIHECISHPGLDLNMGEPKFLLL